MTQFEFNQHVVSILWKMAARLGADRYSEPKHEIVGDEIADMIVFLECNQPQPRSGEETPTGEKS